LKRTNGLKLGWPTGRVSNSLMLHAALQGVIQAGGVLHVAFFERLVQFRLGECRVGPEDYTHVQPLLALNLGQQPLRPAFRAVHIARLWLSRQTIDFTIEQQQRMVTGGGEVPVVAAPLLLAMDPISVPSRSSTTNGGGFRASAPAISSQLRVARPARLSPWVSSIASNDRKREVNTAPRSQIFFEPSAGSRILRSALRR
jgi:hypothetical protein